MIYSPRPRAAVAAFMAALTAVNGQLDHANAWLAQLVTVWATDGTVCPMCDRLHRRDF